MFVEGVGDVFEEDEAEYDVLVFRRIHVVAELVGGEPELGLEAEVCGRIFGSCGFTGHKSGFKRRVGHLRAYPLKIDLLHQNRGIEPAHGGKPHPERGLWAETERRIIRRTMQN